MKWAVELKLEYCSTVKNIFPLIFDRLTLVYSSLGIPVLTRSSIHRKFLALLILNEKHRKRTISKTELEMDELFQITKCTCFNAKTQSGHFVCACAKSAQIPYKYIDFYIDQLAARHIHLTCDCANGHQIKIWNTEMNVIVVHAQNLVMYSGLV